MALPLVGTDVVRVNNAALKALRALQTTTTPRGVVPGTWDRLTAYQLVAFYGPDTRLNDRGREVLRQLADRVDIPGDTELKVSFLGTDLCVPHRLACRNYNRGGHFEGAPF